jgi:hypothetical protein
MIIQKHGFMARASAFVDAFVSIKTLLWPGRQYGMSRICHSRVTHPEERRLDPVPGLDVVPRRDVVVDIHRRARLGVTEALTHYFDVGAHLEQQAGMCVPLVVDSDAAHAGLGDQAIVVAHKVVGADRRADAGGED